MQSGLAEINEKLEDTSATLASTETKLQVQFHHGCVLFLCHTSLLWMLICTSVIYDVKDCIVVMGEGNAE